MPTCPKCKHKFKVHTEDKDRICDFCKEPFTPVREKQRFCTPKCRSDFHNKNLMIAYYEGKANENRGS